MYSDCFPDADKFPLLSPKTFIYFNFCFETKLFRIGYLNCASIPIAFTMRQGSGIFTFTLVSSFFLNQNKEAETL